MEVYRYGWPVAVLQRHRLFWPWDDPAFATNTLPDTGLMIDWTNLLLVPLGAGVLVAAIAAIVPSILRRRLRRAGRCAHWGYNLHDLSRCPECGLMRGC